MLLVLAVLSLLAGCRAAPLRGLAMGSASDEVLVEPVAMPSAPRGSAESAPPAPPASTVAPLPAPRPPCAADVCAACTSCGTNYHHGLGVQLVPGIGAQLLFGWRLSQRGILETSGEASIAFQDLSAEFSGEGQDGKYVAGTLGWLWRTGTCGARVHFLVRAGAALFHVSGRPEEITFDFVDIPGEGLYAGAYAGLGVEVDLGHGFSTGPEVRVLGGVNVSDGEFAVTPVFAWNLTRRY